MEKIAGILQISPQPYVWLAELLFPSWFDPAKIYLAGVGFFSLRKLEKKKQNQFKSQDCGIWVLILSVGGPESERQERAISLDAAVSARSSFKSSSAVLSQQGLISVAWGDCVRLMGGTVTCLSPHSRCATMASVKQKLWQHFNCPAADCPSETGQRRDLWKGLLVKV